MTLVYAILAVIVVALLAAVVVQRVTLPGVPDAVGTESFDGRSLEAAHGLQRGGVDLEQVAQVRFDPALRGYRMAQVDQVIDRLVDEIRERDTEIARLRGGVTGHDSELDERQPELVRDEPQADEAMSDEAVSGEAVSGEAVSDEAVPEPATDGPRDDRQGDGHL